MNRLNPALEHPPRLGGGSVAPDCSASVPEWVAEEIKATWQAARDAGGEMQAFRIIERMVDRLGYGRTENNPSLVPNDKAHFSEVSDSERRIK